MDALFIFRDDLEAIFDALEEDKDVQENFSVAASNVSVKSGFLTRYVDRTC